MRCPGKGRRADIAVDRLGGAWEQDDGMGYTYSQTGERDSFVSRDVGVNKKDEESD